MAKHWSKGQYILCWRDPKSNGRMRISWGEREHCERLAAAMSAEHEPVMYGPLKGTVRIRECDLPASQIAIKPGSKKVAQLTTENEGHPA